MANTGIRVGEEVGRPFAEEIAELDETYRWACGAPVESLSQRVLQLSGRPLLAVGSGGSFTTATIAAGLFRRSERRFSSAISPLGLASQSALLRSASVLLASAGGSNPDVLGALRIAVNSESPSVLALCASVGSRLVAAAGRSSNVAIEEFEPPFGDGFLATNSLLASAVLLTRAFSTAFGICLELPKQLTRLVDASRWQTFVNSISASASELWRRNTTIVLYGPTSLAAAIDLESKLTEAALSNVWIADYRHFAHGLHNWLSKRGDDSSIVAFVSPDDQGIAGETLEQVPGTVLRFVVYLPECRLAELRALAHVFPIVHSAGLARGIDPGRPGIPSFGRRIYRLNAFARTAGKLTTLHPLERAAIERKTQKSIADVERDGQLEYWHAAYTSVTNRIRKARFGAIVLDYDGTLSETSKRYAGLRADVAQEITTLLQAGISIGVATGRGKSVRETLREAIPKKHWRRVTIGYYNGGQIGTLLDDACPDGTPSVIEALSPILTALQSDARLLQLATIEGRQKQITVRAKSPSLAQECWDSVAHLAHLTGPATIKLVRSSHSFDLLPSDVTKLSVIAHLLKRDEQLGVLAIGDMGRWPGNDHELLSHRYSLSVDEVSPDPRTCWNLASPGIRGVQAILEYTARMTVSRKGIARIKLARTAMRGRP